jgi:molybdopterin molybdotransferase
MLQVSEARERLLEHFRRGKNEKVNITEAAGRVLAESVIADYDSPTFTNSAMDGVAVRHDDLTGASQRSPVTLEVVGEIPAGGAENIVVHPGQVAMIMTGAPLPEGADAVVRVEDTDLDYTSEFFTGSVDIYYAAAKGENIRFQGENYAAGSMVLAEGHEILPQDVGMFAMLGKPEVLVYKKPLVGMFASGDELVEPWDPLGEGQIWNSNSHMLAAMIRKFGGEVVDLGIIPDTEAAIHAALKKLDSVPVDLILTSGGVSMGLYDYVRRVLETYGRLSFWKVNMRPGKPLAFGHYRETPFIGLPGNPVSSFVGAWVFVFPAISKMLGKSVVEKSFSHAILEENLQLDGRESYLPGRFTKEGKTQLVRTVGNQSSGNLFALVQANCLIKITPGVQSLKQDSVVEIWRFI